jgi:hypothetical protein
MTNQVSQTDLQEEKVQPRSRKTKQQQGDAHFSMLIPVGLAVVVLYIISQLEGKTTKQ